MFSTGDMKGQKCPNLLHQLAAKETSMSDMATECEKVKLLSRDVQKAFLEETGVKSW